MSDAAPGGVRLAERVSAPDWAAEWICREICRLADIAGRDDMATWEELPADEREIITLALRNLWDEVARRG